MGKFRVINFVLLLVGIAITALGLNIGLGGIKTLGWQLSRDFIDVTDPSLFAIQDSHIRFIGGIWLMVGATFIAGAFLRERLYPSLLLMCGMIAFAGLFRLGGEAFATLFDTDILLSFSLEVLGFPLLALWLYQSQPRSLSPCGN